MVCPRIFPVLLMASLPMAGTVMGAPSGGKSSLSGKTVSTSSSAMAEATTRTFTTKASASTNAAFPVAAQATPAVGSPVVPAPAFTNISPAAADITRSLPTLDQVMPVAVRQAIPLPTSTSSPPVRGPLSTTPGNAAAKAVDLAEGPSPKSAASTLQPSRRTAEETKILPTPATAVSVSPSKDISLDAASPLATSSSVDKPISIPASDRGFPGLSPFSGALQSPIPSPSPVGLPAHFSPPSRQGPPLTTSDQGLVRFEIPGKTEGGQIEPRFQLKQDQVDTVTKLTNPEGQTLLNVVPSAESYKPERVKKLPQGAVIIMIRFQEPCGRMCDQATELGRKDLDEFSSEFVAKLTDMLKRADTKFQLGATPMMLEVTNVVNVKTGVTGEKMVVQMAIHVRSDKFNAVDVTNTLRTLVTRNPPVIRGFKMDSSAFAAEVLQATSNASLVDIERAGLIGAYLVLYVGLFVLSMVAYRRYVNRVTNEILQNRMLEAKNHPRSDSWKSSMNSRSLSYSSSVDRHTLVSVDGSVPNVPLLLPEPSIHGSFYPYYTVDRSVYPVAHPSPLMMTKQVSPNKVDLEPSPYIAPYSREPSTVLFEEFVRPPSTVVDFGVLTTFQSDSDLWDHGLRDGIRDSQYRSMISAKFTSDTLSMSSTVYKR